MVTNVITNIVETGDENPILLLSAVTLVCGIVLVVMALVFMKRRNMEEGEEQS